VIDEDDGPIQNRLADTDFSDTAKDSDGIGSSVRAGE